MPNYLENLTLRLAHGMARLPEDARRRHAEFIKQLQNADGGFPGREGGSDLYYTGFALRSLALLGELHGPLAEQAARYLTSRLTGQTPMIDFLSLLYGAALVRMSAGLDVFEASPVGWRDGVAQAIEAFRRSDGGYAKTDAGHSSSTYHTFLVALAHQLLERATPEPERITAFVRSRRREEGGFVEIGPMRTGGANPTAAAVGLLRMFDALDDETRCGVREFLAGMQTDEGGLRANTRIPIADTLSTFTGLWTLADLGPLDGVDLTAAMRYIQAREISSGGYQGAAWDDATDVEYTFYGLAVTALLTEFTA